jgi:hypothetical protein
MLGVLDSVEVAGAVPVELRATEAKKMEIKFAKAYDRMAQIIANIQNGNMVCSVSVANPNSRHIPFSRNIVRGRIYNTIATPTI